MLKQLEKYNQSSPEIIFEWKDSKTTATGWLVIDSLLNGAAGGGTRLRNGLNKDEVVGLAKTMGLKFKAIGMPIGGAKSGINFDPAHPMKEEVLKRWFKAIRPILKSCYGTGGDLNVDDLREVVPYTKELGILHPQEGIVNGYFQPDDHKRCRIIKQLEYGVTKVIDNPNYTPDVSQKYRIADMATGYGVAEAVKAVYKIYHGDNYLGKKSFIHGWGKVGSAAGFFLAKSGFKINVIADLSGALVSKTGFSFEEIKTLFLNRKDFLNCNIGEVVPSNEINDCVWDIKTDVFIPAAASKLITRNHVRRLLRSGLELVSPGANIPFDESQVFYGEISQYLDAKISLLPDFISNCGMAETFWHLMRESTDITDQKIFNDISETIMNLFRRAYEMNKTKKLLTQTFLKMLINQ
jgi:glutamate dehydrogenase/leucine dehydrogenase